MTIWEPISVFRALRWDASLNAEQYLRASVSVAVLMLLVGLMSAFLGFITTIRGVDVESFFQPGFLNALISDPILIVTLLPVVVGILFTIYMSIKLAVMRIHAFNLSGWWLLIILGIMAGLGYFESGLLDAVFSSLVSLIAYFFNPKSFSRWQTTDVFQVPAIRLESLIILLYTVWIWFTILGDPFFILIDMI